MGGGKKKKKAPPKNVYPYGKDGFLLLKRPRETVASLRGDSATHLRRERGVYGGVGFSRDLSLRERRHEVRKAWWEFSLRRGATSAGFPSTRLRLSTRTRSGRVRLYRAELLDAEDEALCCSGLRTGPSLSSPQSSMSTSLRERGTDSVPEAAPRRRPSPCAFRDSLRARRTETVGLRERGTEG